MDVTWWVTLFLWFGVPSALLAVVAFAIRKALVKHWGQADIGNADMRGKVAVVTGASSGIGFHTAEGLANRGATVIVTGRTLKAAKRVVIQLRHRTFLGQFVPYRLDLGSLASVFEFCEAVKGNFDALDLLICNAGVLMPSSKREKTVEDYELHFGVNHLAHFYMTNLLMPLLKKRPSRIIVVSSMNHRGIRMNFDDLLFEKTEIKDTSMSGNPMYKQSKLANILFVQELRRRVKAEKMDVKVFACCPGLVMTNISRNMDLPFLASTIYPLFYFLFKTPIEGAQTTLHCALSKNVDDGVGVLYRHCRPWSPPERSYMEDFFTSTGPTSYSSDDAQKLWTESEELTKTKFSL